MTIRPDDRTKWRPGQCVLTPEDAARLFPAVPLLLKATLAANVAILKMLRLDGFVK